MRGRPVVEKLLIAERALVEPVSIKGRCKFLCRPPLLQVEVCSHHFTGQQILWPPSRAARLTPSDVVSAAKSYGQGIALRPIVIPPKLCDLTSDHCLLRRPPHQVRMVARKLAKLPVMLDVPLATGFTASFATFGIKQYPSPPSSRLGADSCIVLPEASFEVSRPADIGSAIIFALAPQHINEKEHLVL
jgi:hypothetical protein